MNLPAALKCLLIVLGGLNLGLTAAVDESPWVSLFDGVSLANWEGDPLFWRVEDGAIVGETTLQHQPRIPSAELIWQGGTVADFELKVEFKINTGNTGIFYRGFPRNNSPWMVGGYQADFSFDMQWSGVAFGMVYKGMLAACGEKALIGQTPEDRRVIAMVGDREEIISRIDPREWNEYHIIARGNHLIQMINGVVVCEFSESAEDRLREGLLAVQVHAGRPMKARFRNIRLRTLEANDKREVLFLVDSESKDRSGWKISHLLARSLNESGLDVIAQVTDDPAGPPEYLGYQNPAVVVLNCSRGNEPHSHEGWISQISESGSNVLCLDLDRIGESPRNLQNDSARAAIVSRIVRAAGIALKQVELQTRRPSDLDFTLN